jgi:hypothetical protein
MWTFKNVMAVGLFLFGTTFLWMTASFTGRTPPPSGGAWTIVNALAMVSLVGFAVAAWGVYKQFEWWEVAAAMSGVMGLASVVPFVVGESQLDVGFADPGVQINLWMHVIGSLAAITIAVLPAAHDWVTRRL